MSKRDLNFGKIEIAPDVIFELINKALKKLSNIDLMDGIGENISEAIKRERYKKGIKLKFSNNLLSAEIRVKIKKGINIPGIAEKAQKKIKKSIELLSGVKVNQINILVDNIYG